jgi:geranylgeranyl diphosphate synthase type II
MLAHLLRTISGNDATTLDQILDKNRYQKSPEEVTWVITKMGEYGSLEYADKLMRQFGKEAHEYFLKELDFLKFTPARDYIDYLPEFLVNRDH